MQPIEKGLRFVGGCATVDCGLHQAAGLVALTETKGSYASLKKLFGFALSFCECAPSPVDVCTCSRVSSIEEQGARPDVDRLLVSPCDVVIQACNEQLFDLGIAICIRRDVDRT